MITVVEKHVESKHIELGNLESAVARELKISACWEETSSYMRLCVFVFR